MPSRTPFLSVGLAMIAKPELERIHRIGEQGKEMIDLSKAANFEQIQLQFENALKWIIEQRRKEL